MPSPYLFSVPRPVLAELLHKASRDSEYSEIAARTSLLLDLDKGKPRSRADYARQWGWTPKEVRNRWDAIVADVTDWITSYGRQSSTAHAKNLSAWLDEQARLSDAMRAVHAGEKQGHGRGTDRGTENGPDDPKNKGSGHGRGTGGARHTKQPFNPEATPLNKEKARPRDLEDVMLYAVEMERPDLAQPFFDYHTAGGWRVGRNPMKDWKAAFRTWQTNDEQRNGKRPHTDPRSHAASGHSRPGSQARNYAGAGSADPFAAYDRIRAATAAARTHVGGVD